LDQWFQLDTKASFKYLKRPWALPDCLYSVNPYFPTGDQWTFDTHILELQNPEISCAAIHWLGVYTHQSPERPPFPRKFSVKSTLSISRAFRPTAAHDYIRLCLTQPWQSLIYPFGDLAPKALMRNIPPWHSGILFERIAEV